MKPLVFTSYLHHRITNVVLGSRSNFVSSMIKMFKEVSLISVKGRGITACFEIGVSEVSLEEEEIDMFKGGEA